MDLHDIEEALRESEDCIVRISTPTNFWWREGELIYNKTNDDYSVHLCNDIVSFSIEDVDKFQWDAQSILEIVLEK